ncbi:MAG: TatD family hydrolase [Capnocytophaga sp.]|nr:TatD family hydrolase [Capnocytophaga sp.]
MKLLDIHSHKNQSSENVIVISNQYPLTAQTDNYFSTGIHPWYSDNWEAQWEALLRIAKRPNCVAIGECGLDKNVSTDMDLQHIIFEKHIALSETLQKPLIIHCVKAHNELIVLKKKHQPTQDWILHGFNKNQNMANRLLQHQIKLSFGKALLSNIAVQEVFKSVPEGSYFLETDDADIDLRALYQKAKELKNHIAISFPYLCVKIIL